MSDNRKYYYLKLKENYFDEDAIVLLESMQDGNIFHRRMTRRETPSEVKARLLSKARMGLSSAPNKKEMEV